jgi:hypothetical protein
MSQGPPGLAPWASHAPDAVPLPQEGESLHAYRARLWALHDHLSTLIDAVERGSGDQPVPAPAAAPTPVAADSPPGHTAERIALARHALERQAQRQADPFAARESATARRRARVPSLGQVDPVHVCWAINVVCWLLISGVALIWGLGSN